MGQSGGSSNRAKGNRSFGEPRILRQSDPDIPPRYERGTSQNGRFSSWFPFETHQKRHDTLIAGCPGPGQGAPAALAAAGGTGGHYAGVFYPRKTKPAQKERPYMFVCASRGLLLRFVFPFEFGAQFGLYDDLALSQPKHRSTKGLLPHCARLRTCMVISFEAQVTQLAPLPFFQEVRTQEGPFHFAICLGLEGVLAANPSEFESSALPSSLTRTVSAAGRFPTARAAF